MVKLTIDGKEIETSEGKTILEAARDNGISIPTLCFHANLLSIGSCRICVVEAEGYPNPMASCQTVAQAGMSVRTKSDKLFAMRQDYLKLILAYHPLDCPICDAGGECDLQDLVFEHRIEKADLSVHRERKIDSYATPLIKYFENRCVLCLRCIHACREVSGRNVLDLVETGIEARMAPTGQKNCISCGECLFVCPVGALTENLSPVKSRLWQVERHPTTCPHCGFGCTFELDVFEGRIVTDVIQDVKNMPNKGSLCVMGRFGYDFVNHEARIEKASAKSGPLGFSQAVSLAYDRLTKLDNEGKAIGFLVSPRATNEEIFLVKEIAGRFKKASLSTSAFYHTGRVIQAFDEMGMNYPYEYDRLLDADLVVVAGANLLSNNHVLGDRIREAYKLRGVKIIVIDPSPTSLIALADVHLKVKPGMDASLLNALGKRLTEGNKGGSGAEAFSGSESVDRDTASQESGVEAAEFDRAHSFIGRAKNVAIVFGSGISESRESLQALLNFSVLLGADKKGLVMPVARESNGVGAVSITGSSVAPHEVLSDPETKALFFYEDDPFHYVSGETINSALETKEFVIVADALPTTIMDRADLVVPTGTFTEKNGTFLSGDGFLRKLTRVTKNGPSQSGSGFDFLRELLVKLGGNDYATPHRVTEALREKGLIRDTGNGGQMRAAGGSAKFPTVPETQVVSGNGGYTLVFRDVFSSHYLAGKEAYSRGVSTVYQHPSYPISEDKLFISPEDASALGLTEGDIIDVESGSGLVHKPVSIKEGLRQGVLEYVVFKDRQQALRLSASPAKWVGVKARKG